MEPTRSNSSSCEGDINVLIIFGERRRPLTLKNGNRSSDLKTAFFEAFGDIVNEANEQFFFQLESDKWGGRFVDLTEEDALLDNAVVKAVPLQDVAEKGVSLCKKVSKPTQEHRSIISKLFPSGSSSSAAKPAAHFNPSVSLHPKLKLKLKKKKTPVRIKPYKRWVIVMESPMQIVPTAGVRRQLKKNGREKKIEFKRSLSDLQVKNAIVESFPCLRLDSPSFWKCEHSNKLEQVTIQGYPDGEELFDVASKETLYVVEDEVIVVKDEVSSHTDCSSDEGTTSRPKRSKVDMVMDDGFSSADDQFNHPFGSLSPYDYQDTEFEKPTANDEEQESLVQRRALIANQDQEYMESLRIDQEKTRLELDATRRAEKLEVLRGRLREKFAIPGSGIMVSIRSLTGESLKYTFNMIATTKDLYQFVYSHGNVDDSFAMYNMTPRRKIVCDETKLADLPDVTRSLIVVETSADGTDPCMWCDNSPATEDQTKCLVHGGFIEELIQDLSENKQEDKEDKSLVLDYIMVLEREKEERKDFMASSSFIEGNTHFINREDLFEGTIQLFHDANTLRESTLSIAFDGELGVDAGGVSRDLLSAFWEITYGKFFDGSALLRPVVHPNVRSELWSTLGAALSHGYLVSGFLPVRIVFPSLVATLKGPQVQVSSSIVRSCFVDYVSTVESALLKSALQCQSSFPEDLQSRLNSFFYRFDCRERPTKANVLQLLDKVARYEFLTKPMASIAQMHYGITRDEQDFWQKKSVESLYDLYNSLLTSPSKVLEMIDESFFDSRNEERVFGYLQQFVGNMTSETVQKFLRFVTGASVAVCPKITVQFNSLSGLARRPIAHTCGSVLELPASYDTYVDFANEFQKVLADEHYAWVMDCI